MIESTADPDRPRTPIEVGIEEGVTMSFVPIPAGTFRMGQWGERGNEEPVTEVKVGAFWMGETSVTQEQYRVMAAGCAEELGRIEGNGGTEPSYCTGRDDSERRPVESVNWHEARVVAGWLTALMRGSGLLPEGHVVDLPGEVQWEYACRANTETDYWRGDGEAALAEAGWYDGNAGGESHVVKGKPGSAWGLYDMHGNVWEWCRDVWDGRANRLRVPGVGEDGLSDDQGEGDRVLRGGSWLGVAWYCRAAFRLRYRPGSRYVLFGFRLAVVPGPSSQQGPEARPEAEPGAAEPRDEAEQAEAAGGASSAKAMEDETDGSAGSLPPRRVPTAPP